MSGRTVVVLAVVVACAAWPAPPASAQITADNVLVIVNTNSADSTAIRDAYVAKYPGVHVWTYAGSTSASISRDTFKTEIRDPLDSYLRSGGTPLCFKIRVLVSTKGVPRRIHDIDGTGIGDNAGLAGAEFDNQKYDAAAVDSELVLVHQNLKAGATPLPDNYANQFIHNPYHAGTTRIHDYSRSNVDHVKNFTFNYSAWGWESVTTPAAKVLTPGDIYLVTRLEAYTSAEAIAALNRAGIIPYDKPNGTVVLDKDAVNDFDDDGPYSQGVDFPETRNVLQANGFNVDYDATAAFLTTASRGVIGYAGLGVNHSPAPPSPAKMYILNSLQFTLAPGAIFNTYESWNGRNFEAANPLDPAQHDAQGQVADWLHIGGTLAVGHVFEPFTFSVVDNEILYERLLVRGWTFAEAAYAAMPVISWQNIVVGDPLAAFRQMGEVTAWHITANHGPSGAITSDVASGYVEPRKQGIRTLAADFSRQVAPATVVAGAVTITDSHGGDLSALIQSLQLDGSHLKLTITLSAALPDAERYAVRITSTLKDTGGLPFGGSHTLGISALAGDADGSGRVTGADILAVRQRGGQALSALTARYDLDGSGGLTGTDMLAARNALGRALP